MSPRPKLYFTIEDRKEAKRISNQKYKNKLRERKLLTAELNGFRIDNINLGNNILEKLSKEERKARHDATISKLTAVDTSHDIFNFNFDVAENLKPLVQKKFGETMEKFLNEINYSDKYAIRFQFNDR
jgi:hypothetical protein